MMNFLILNLVINYETGFYALLLLSIIVIGIFIYIVINQNDKLETYEEQVNVTTNVLNDIYKIVSDSYQKVLEADKNNLYEADDDIGFIYTTHKNLIKSLVDFFDAD